MDLTSASRLARELMDEHGLTDWRLELDQAKRRAGVCRHARKVIGLSAPLTRLHDEAEVRDTVLHEIAHAVCGPAAGHGPVWQATAVRLGASGERCVPVDAPTVKGEWQGRCPRGHEFDRIRRPERVLLCTRCRGHADRDRIIEWRHLGRTVPMHPNFEAELRSILDGVPFVRLGVGHRARITVPGDHFGREGTVVKTGRTTYTLKAKGVLLKVAFAGVEPL